MLAPLTSASAARSSAPSLRAATARAAGPTTAESAASPGALTAGGEVACSPRLESMEEVGGLARDLQSVGGSGAHVCLGVWKPGKGPRAYRGALEPIGWSLSLSRGLAADLSGPWV